MSKQTLLGMLGVVAMYCCTFSAVANQLGADIGQKLMLDIRYFCADGTPADNCRTPVTRLPEPLAKVIQRHNIGGVILFAENIQSVEQVRSLIEQLQTAAAAAGLPPLLIAVDQEGGRVARLPVTATSAFSGNMAIGATYEKHQTHYATAVNTAIAQQLNAVGINVNFAPAVDVNVNPLNPVINVRSYSESPEVVAQLSQAAVSALQSNGIISAMKHFPGHGDTHVDSHTGLPVVEHSRDVVERVDLYPFAMAIAAGDQAAPGMIMTAHIQYPALDNSVFTSVNGEATIVPATLSRRILTGLLREELKYQGVVVTDALDMAGISAYLTPKDALLHTFYAGADIALMPMPLRNANAIAEFDEMLAHINSAISANDKSAVSGVPTSKQMRQSAQRIERLKQCFLQQVSIASSATIEMPKFSRLAEQLAQASLTLVVGDPQFTLAKREALMLIMPDEARCQAQTDALVSREYQVLGCISLANQVVKSTLDDLIASADAVMIGDISPSHSLAEMGGMDDLIVWQNRIDKNEQLAWTNYALAAATKENKTRIFVALRAPYVIEQFAEYVDLAIVTYDYRVLQTEAGRPGGIVFDVIAEFLQGDIRAPGTLPVTLAPAKSPE
ncbi:glycoside hydrolase family 3 protein [Alteromonas sp. ASW11-36]|uniref:beta-N-acetylhexosaminidase n=1 Tax=Alteromonas arenosi TaxID=3055817 RepID=A0ABT7SZC2_9ALTE|nr:glycoside hydrolase family 3 protein [Alteromonas sp. ASW11-36]MDM7861530.1 glycoside hydrolase family 3 protein [Alteromonas sp. ASW11-36]